MPLKQNALCRPSVSPSHNHPDTMDRANLLAIVYLVIGVVAVFIAGQRLLAGMWFRGALMTGAALFCAYRFHTMYYDQNES